MTAEDEIRRGSEAARLLSEPLLKKAFEDLKAGIVQQWSEVPARDAEGREWIWRHYKAVEATEGMLRTYVESGRIALSRLEPTKVEKVKKFFIR